MMRRWWIGPMAVCLLASVLLAKPGIVKTIEGRSLRGDIKENSPDANSVSVNIDGVVIVIPRSDIASIDYSSIADQFHVRLDVLGPFDIKGRLALSRWALDNKQYDLATEAALAAKKIDPNDPDVAIMLNTIESQKLIDALPKSTGPSTESSMPPATTASGGGAGTVAATAPTGKFLTMNDIYAIRRAELQAGEDVRVKFLDQVQARFLSRYGGNAAQFNSEPPTQQALDIIGSGDAALEKKVEVVTDPRVLLVYRNQIQARVLAGCATSGCHGEAAAGGFFLYPNAEPTAAAYTNFYILQSTSRTLAGGETFGRGPVARPMIDRFHPEASLILQFGLPASLASTPHPKAPGWRPIFRDQQDPVYREIYQWIGSLTAIEPSYGIKFGIPTTNPAQ